MSLFPAYGQDGVAASSPAREECGAVAVAAARWDVAEAAESELLASSDSEAEAPREPAPPRSDPDPDYYVDRRFDGGNLRVSTIYYPGRPEYKSVEPHLAIGLSGAGARSRRKRRRTRRYWETADAAPRGAEAEGEEAGERGAALRRALVDRPRDEDLWLQYIDYQEWLSGAPAGLSAAQAAAARLPRSARLRARRHAAARRALSAQDLVAGLRDELAAEKDPAVAGELWVRLVGALARAPEAGVSGAQAAVAAAARGLRRLPHAYPALLHEYGAVLRAAGLWEMLVLLLELLLPLCCPPAASAAFPPARDPAAERATERGLHDYEDKVVSSGLPSGAVWARVERARGAAHWRPARGGHVDADAAADADPQRAPALADVADLLLPAADPLPVLITALRLAKVPLFPGAQYVQAADTAEGADWELGEALLVLARAARRLPARHPARPAPAQARALLQLAVDPPHYCSDDYGYRSWVESMWEAALSASAASGAGGAGGASGAGAESALAQLLSWRMSWLHSQLLLLEDSPKFSAEARRIRDAAQTTLRRFGGSLALPFAQFARVAHAASAVSGAGAASAGLRAATVALRAALQDDSVPHHQLLYIARIVSEVSESSAGLSPAGACALASAVLRRAPPDHMRASAELLLEAREECERRCAALEEEMEREDAEEPEAEWSSPDAACAARLRRALLPAPAEWACARALLAAPARRAELLQAALSTSSGDGRSWRLSRWREQQAVTLALLAPRGAAAARALSASHPHNVLLALMAGSAPAPSWSGSAGAGGVVPGAPPSAVQTLGAAWPLLLRAAGSGWAAPEAGALARRLRRLEAAPAPLWALRLEAEARAPAPRLERVALQAIMALPHHKWLVVRGAALGAAGGGGALPDVLLERGLRLHALPDELRALQPLSGTRADADADADTDTERT